MSKIKYLGQTSRSKIPREKAWVSETDTEIRQGFLVTFSSPSTVVETNKGAHKASGQHSHPSCNLRTGFKRLSETNKETAVSGKQSGYLPYQEADLEGPEKNEGTTFLATFRQSTFFILTFYSVFLSL